MASLIWKCHDDSKSTIYKAMAIYYALRLASDMTFQKIVTEFDNKSSINLLL